MSKEIEIESTPFELPNEPVWLRRLKEEPIEHPKISFSTPGLMEVQGTGSPVEKKGKAPEGEAPGQTRSTSPKL